MTCALKETLMFYSCRAEMLNIKINISSCDWQNYNTTSTSSFVRYVLLRALVEKE